MIWEVYAIVFLASVIMICSVLWRFFEPVLSESHYTVREIVATGKSIFFFTQVSVSLVSEGLGQNIKTDKFFIMQMPPIDFIALKEASKVCHLPGFPQFPFISSREKRIARTWAGLIVGVCAFIVAGVIHLMSLTMSEHYTFY